MVGIRLVETCQVEDEAAKISGYDSSASYHSHTIDSIELSVLTLKSSRFRFESFLLLMLGTAKALFTMPHCTGSYVRCLKLKSKNKARLRLTVESKRLNLSNHEKNSECHVTL